MFAMSYNSRLNILDIEIPENKETEFLDAFRFVEEIPRAIIPSSPLYSQFGGKIYHEMAHVLNYWGTSFGMLIQNARIEFYLKSGEILRNLKSNNLFIPFRRIIYHLSKNFFQKHTEFYNSIFSHIFWENSFISYLPYLMGSLDERDIIEHFPPKKVSWRNLNYEIEILVVKLLKGVCAVPIIKSRSLKTDNVLYEVLGAHKIDEFLGLAMERAFRDYRKDQHAIKLSTIQYVFTYETPIIVAEYFGLDPKKDYKFIILAALQALNPQIKDYQGVVNNKFNNIYHPGILFFNRIIRLKKYLEKGGILHIDAETLTQFHPHLMKLDQFQSIRQELFFSSLKKFFESFFSFSDVYCQDWYSLSQIQMMDSFDFIYSIEQSKAFFFPYIYRIKTGQNVRLLWDESKKPLLLWVLYSNIIYDLTWDQNAQVTCFFKKERNATILNEICQWEADERCGILNPTKTFNQSKNCPFESIIKYLNLHAKKLEDLELPDLMLTE